MMFYVWRRISPNEHRNNYLGITAHMPQNLPAAAPKERYELLLNTSDFDEAADFLNDLKAKVNAWAPAQHPLV